jgi:exodeoxyribonuclease VII small subunit
VGSDPREGRGGAASERPLEATLEELEQVVARLEAGDLGLEEALAAFERGVRLARECESRLEQTERRIEMLLRGPDGSLTTRPLDPTQPPAGAPGRKTPTDGDGE